MSQGGVMIYDYYQLFITTPSPPQLLLIIYATGGESSCLPNHRKFCFFKDNST